MMKPLSVVTIMVFLLLPQFAFSAQCDGPGDPDIKTAISPQANAETHVVADWALAESVKRRCPERRLSTQVNLGTKIHVWMRSAGNKKALERLIKDKRLPFKHIWKYKVGTGWSIKDRVKVTGNNVTDTDIAGLVLEAKNRGFFDWRTFSNKKNLKKGIWRVDIIDRLGENVICANSGSPCPIEFKIK
jgi:hypothetical protein